MIKVPFTVFRKTNRKKSMIYPETFYNEYVFAFSIEIILNWYHFTTVAITVDCIIICASTIGSFKMYIWHFLSPLPPMLHLVMFFFNPLYPASFTKKWKTLEWNWRRFFYTFGFLIMSNYIKGGRKAGEKLEFDLFVHTFYYT